MGKRLNAIPVNDAIGIGASLLSTVEGFSKPPANARRLALAAAAVVPGLASDAEAAQVGLVGSLGSLDGAVIHRGGGVQKALAEEKDVDLKVNALEGRLASNVKVGMEGAEALYGFLFPDGARALTRPTGRPQRAIYDRWLESWAERPAQDSTADKDIAAALKAVSEAVKRFGDVLDGKDNRSQAATSAVDDAGDARTTWNDAMGDLVDAIELVHATEPDRFQDWLAPYHQWRRAQEARSTREKGFEEQPPPEAKEVKEAKEAPTEPATSASGQPSESEPGL